MPMGMRLTRCYHIVVSSGSQSKSTLCISQASSMNAILWAKYNHSTNNHNDDPQTKLEGSKNGCPQTNGWCHGGNIHFSIYSPPSNPTFFTLRRRDQPLKLEVPWGKAAKLWKDLVFITQPAVFYSLANVRICEISFHFCKKWQLNIL